MICPRWAPGWSEISVDVRRLHAHRDPVHQLTD